MKKTRIFDFLCMCQISKISYQNCIWGCWLTIQRIHRSFTFAMAFKIKNSMIHERRRVVMILVTSPIIYFSSSKSDMNVILVKTYRTLRTKLLHYLHCKVEDELHPFFVWISRFNEFIIIIFTLINK